MERGYWVMLIVIALAVGLIVGFGLASRTSRVPGLEQQVQQLARENADLKAKLAAQAAPPAQAPGATPATAVQPAKP